MTSRVVPFRRVEGAMAEMSDEALVAACAVGEAAALGALFDRYYDAVRGFLARLSGTDDRDLDDLVQTTFGAVSRAARRFDGRAPVKTWLFGVANNVTRHHVRAEVRRKQLAAAAAAQPPPPSADPTEELLERERQERVRRATAALPPKLREAFVLVYMEGIPGKDVAALLGVNEGTIWKRLHQARAELRAALEGEGS